MERSHPPYILSPHQLKKIYLEESSIKKQIISTAKKEQLAKNNKYAYLGKLALLSKRLDDHYKRNAICYKKPENSRFHKYHMLNKRIFYESIEFTMCDRNSESTYFE